MDVLGGLTEKAMYSVSTTMGLAATVLGAGSGTMVISLVRKWLPEQTGTITDEALATIVGFVMFYFGDRIHPLVQSFGFGLLMSAVGAWASGFVQGLVPS